MTDLQLAKANLVGHSICLCKDGVYFTDDGKGISPMMCLIAEKRDLNGYSAADLIVGKAAAILFVKAGVVSVYGKVMSTAGKAYLDRRHIPCTYETLTEKIINRAGTDICPMEKAVKDIDDTEEGYIALKEKLRALT